MNNRIYMKLDSDNPFIEKLHQNLLSDARSPEDSGHIQERALILDMSIAEYKSFISQYPHRSFATQEQFRTIIIWAYIWYTQVREICKRK